MLCQSTKQNDITSQKTSLNSDYHWNLTSHISLVFCVCVCVCIFFFTIMNLAAFSSLTDSVYRRPPTDTSQEIPFHYQTQILCSVHSLPFIPVLIHMNPLQTFPIPSPPFFFSPVSILILSSVFTLPSLFHPYLLTNNVCMHFFAFSCVLYAKTVVLSLFLLS